MRFRITNNGPYQIKFSDMHNTEHRLLPGDSRVIDGVARDVKNVGAPDDITEPRYYAEPVWS
jgi:hypothetical protein